MDQFVFVSHASKDKHLLRPLVQALIDVGVKVWLDAPAALGYSDTEIDRWFYRIRAGGRWDDEIDEAKRKASCILVCWSKRAEGEAALARHPVWFEEASYGRTERKLVSCRIDDMNPASIPGGWGAQQTPDVRGETDRRLIVDDVRRMMESRAASLAEGRSNDSGRRNPRVPFLADRTVQEEAVEAALDTLASTGGVRPFFIVGPENECIDEFVKRLEEDTSRRCLGGDRGWHTVPVEWPAGEAAGGFGKSFARRVGQALELRGYQTINDIAAGFSAKRQPVAVVSPLHAEGWKRDESARIRAWLELWASVAAVPGHRAVLPILRIKMPAAKPGWSGVPCNGGWFDGARKRNQLIWQSLQGFAESTSGLQVGLPPILCPLPESDIDMWRDRHFALHDADRAPVLDALSRLLAVRAHKRHGIPHKSFADAMMPFFRGAARS